MRAAYFIPTGGNVPDHIQRQKLGRTDASKGPGGTGGKYYTTGQSGPPDKDDPGWRCLGDYWIWTEPGVMPDFFLKPTAAMSAEIPFNNGIRLQIPAARMLPRTYTLIDGKMSHKRNVNYATFYAAADKLFNTFMAGSEPDEETLLDIFDQIIQVNYWLTLHEIVLLWECLDTYNIYRIAQCVLDMDQYKRWQDFLSETDRCTPASVSDTPNTEHGGQD